MSRESTGRDAPGRKGAERALASQEDTFRAVIQIGWRTK